MTLAETCHSCRSARCAGACTCVGDSSGEIIQIKIASGVCPLGYFDTPPAYMLERLTRGKATAPATITPVPLDQWPMWALRLSRRRKPGDAGVGDTAQRKYARWGGEIYKRFMRKIGKSCGCNAAQASWNAMYPYSA